MKILTDKQKEEIKKELHYLDMEAFMMTLRGHNKYKEAYAYLRGKHQQKIKCILEGHIE